MASRIDPRDSENWCLLGAVTGQMGIYAEAISCCERALRLAPDYAVAHLNLAQAHMHLSQYAEAARAYEAYLKKNPENTDARNAYALALDSSSRHREAVEQFREVLRLNPRHGDAWFNVAIALLALGDAKQGMIALRRAIELDPSATKPRVTLGILLANTGDTDAAQGQFDAVRRIDPANRDADFGLAIVLEKRGDFAAAWNQLQPYFDANAQDERFFIALAKVARHVDRAREAAERIEDAMERGIVAPADAGALHFALGKLYDGMQDYDSAFRHFAAANSLASGASGGNDDFVARMQAAQSVFTAEFLARAPRAGVATERPIFIVGMPRSGTTLTEQILQSHTRVHGGGELPDINEISLWLANRLTGTWPASLASADQATLDDAARRYLTRLTELSAGAPHVTDKMPHNFINLGLIALLFPRARIVHCHRHPLDNCFSIFTYEFNATHAYATDLARLGEHYRDYAALMAHWRNVLPLPIFDLSYEAMVADQEATTRRLLDFLGLAFEDSCLRFHESARTVNTFSYDQVRRPIYRKSVERWRHYAHHLGPLMESLGMPPIVHESD